MTCNPVLIHPLKIYIASQFLPYAQAVAFWLKNWSFPNPDAKGYLMPFEVVSSWHRDQVLSFGKVTNRERKAEIAKRDFQDLDRADLLILCTGYRTDVNPGGKHVETGYALGKQKPVLLLGEPENLMLNLPEIRVAKGLEDLGKWLLVLYLRVRKCVDQGLDRYDAFKTFRTQVSPLLEELALIQQDPKYGRCLPEFLD